MRQFFTWTEDDFQMLEQHARRACVVFWNQELPPGCIPARRKIGFGIDPKTGRASLFVGTGVLYTGPNETISRWIKTTELSFSAFTDLRRWIQAELKQTFEPNSDNPLIAPIVAAAARCGLNLRGVDPAVPQTIALALAVAQKEPSPANIEDIVSAALSVAAAQGYDEIMVCPGSLIICKPLNPKP